ncbi:hypothetical protein OG394_27275 [Kribbella sp. NBC_01245]|uniref:hypothetical protein n=1 Tax=Kribbella sp. NBC_01245 TaxID=2903578 RepID=UPI002E28D935|nr:hypothetical protein [Kribbella sp. NBC_01245]
MRFSIARAAGVVAAVALLGTGAITTAHGATTAGATSAATTASVPALPAGKITFVDTAFGSYKPNNEWSTGLYVPKGWKDTKLSTDHHRYTGGKGHYSLRVNSWLRKPVPQPTAAKQKIAALKGTKGLKIVSLTTGQVKRTTLPTHPVHYYTTLTYTYVDAKGAKRLVMTRWVADWSGTKRLAEVELTAAGRPMDKAGLTSVLAVATQTLGRSG